MPDLKEVLGNYFRVLPTWPDRMDPQRHVWQKLYDDLNRKLSDLGKLRMYHADRARHTRTRVEQTDRAHDQGRELLESSL